MAYTALGHTFLWVLDAEDPHLIEQFWIDAGVTSFNTIKIVPLITSQEGVLEEIKEIHGLRGGQWRNVFSWKT